MQPTKIDGLILKRIELQSQTEIADLVAYSRAWQELADGFAAEAMTNNAAHATRMALHYADAAARGSELPLFAAIASVKVDFPEVSAGVLLIDAERDPEDAQVQITYWWQKD